MLICYVFAILPRRCYAARHAADMSAAAVAMPCCLLPYMLPFADATPYAAMLRYDCFIDAYGIRCHAAAAVLMPPRAATLMRAVTPCLLRRRHALLPRMPLPLLMRERARHAMILSRPTVQCRHGYCRCHAMARADAAAASRRAHARCLLRHAADTPRR